MFIKRCRKKYDVIFLDAYQGGHIPFHLTTVEFLQEVKKILKKDGVVSSNILSPFKNKFFDSMVLTYKEVFPQLYVFNGEDSRNFIFVATTGEKKRKESEVTAKSKKIQTRRKLDFDLSRLSWNYGYYTEYLWEGKVLTDDFAPVNLYKHMKRGE